MQETILIASIFGPFMVVTGFWLILNPDRAIKVGVSVKSNAALFHLGGLTNLFLGLAILFISNSWKLAPTILVPILGLILILRGLLALFAPQIVLNQTNKVLGDKRLVRISGISPLIYGLLLCWLAFL